MVNVVPEISRKLSFGFGHLARQHMQLSRNKHMNTIIRGIKFKSHDVQNSCNVSDRFMYLGSWSNWLYQELLQVGSSRLIQGFKSSTGYRTAAYPTRDRYNSWHYMFDLDMLISFGQPVNNQLWISKNMKLSLDHSAWLVFLKLNLTQLVRVNVLPVNSSWV